MHIPDDVSLRDLMKNRMSYEQCLQWHYKTKMAPIVVGHFLCWVLGEQKEVTVQKLGPFLSLTKWLYHCMMDSGHDQVSVHSLSSLPEADIPEVRFQKQMSAREVTSKHVEGAIGRMKHFRILQSVIKVCMWDSSKEIVYVCCILANAGLPLVF